MYIFFKDIKWGMELARLRRRPRNWWKRWSGGTFVKIQNTKTQKGHIVGGKDGQVELK